MHRVLRAATHPALPVAGPDQSGATAGTRATAGAAALFERVREDRSRAILDLGPAAGSSLRVYGRFARWVRFADALAEATSPQIWRPMLEALPPNPERPYDVVVAWDILDRLPPKARPALVERLTALSGPEARLFVVTASPDHPPLELLHFALETVDRMRYEHTGLPHPRHPPLLPAEVNRLLMPFEVTRAFSTQVGLREYVAVRRGDGAVGSA
ncbi:MAG: methyltransferase domain-containing protein [Gemmatimonadota bacterium]